MAKFVKQRKDTALELLMRRKLRKIVTSDVAKENNGASASTGTVLQEKRPEAGEADTQETNTLG